MLWVAFQVDIEMRGPTIGIVIVDHLAMDMHQTARWAMLTDCTVDAMRLADTSCRVLQCSRLRSVASRLAKAPETGCYRWSHGNRVAVVVVTGPTGDNRFECEAVI